MLRKIILEITVVLLAAMTIFLTILVIAKAYNLPWPILAAGQTNSLSLWQALRGQ